MWSLPAASIDHGLADEGLLKSAYIYNFALFTRWPHDAAEPQNAPLNLCTAGTDDLVISLERLAGETIHGRPVSINTFDAEDAGGACHMLYIAGSEHRHFARLIEQTLAYPVLTISEIRGFADAGGIIQLYRARNRIRFKINLDAARGRNLNLSARLLDLAELVHERVTP